MRIDKRIFIGVGVALGCQIIKELLSATFQLGRATATLERLTKKKSHKFSVMPDRDHTDIFYFDSRYEAEETLDTLSEMIKKYNHLSMADLVEVLGGTPLYKDTKIGWTKIDGFCIYSTQKGYVLAHPRPEKI